MAPLLPNSANLTPQAHPPVVALHASVVKALQQRQAQSEPGNNPTPNTATVPLHQAKASTPLVQLYGASATAPNLGLNTALWAGAGLVLGLLKGGLRLNLPQHGQTPEGYTARRTQERLNFTLAGNAPATVLYEVNTEGDSLGYYAMAMHKPSPRLAKGGLSLKQHGGLQQKEWLLNPQSGQVQKLFLQTGLWGGKTFEFEEARSLPLKAKPTKTGAKNSPLVMALMQEVKGERCWYELHVDPRSGELVHYSLQTRHRGEAGKGKGALKTGWNRLYTATRTPMASEKGKATKLGAWQFSDHTGKAISHWPQGLRLKDLEGEKLVVNLQEAQAKLALTAAKAQGGPRLKAMALWGAGTALALGAVGLLSTTWMRQKDMAKQDRQNVRVLNALTYLHTQLPTKPVERLSVYDAQQLGFPLGQAEERKQAHAKLKTEA
jgi:hypothetical protein